MKKKIPNIPKTKNQKKKKSQSFSQTYPFQITKTQIKKLNQTNKRSNKTIENKLHKKNLVESITFARKSI